MGENEVSAQTWRVCPCSGQKPDCRLCGGHGYYPNPSTSPRARPQKSFSGQTWEQIIQERQRQKAAAQKEAESAESTKRRLAEDEEIASAYRTGRGYQVSWCKACGKMKVGIQGNLFIASTINTPCAKCGGTEFRS